MDSVEWILVRRQIDSRDVKDALCLPSKEVQSVLLGASRSIDSLASGGPAEAIWWDRQRLRILTADWCAFGRTETGART